MLLKKAHVKREQAHIDSVENSKEVEHERPTILMDCFWFTGAFTLLSSVFVNSVAVNYSSIIMVAGTSPLTIIFNAILAAAILKEKFVWLTDGLMVAILVVGTVICTA